MVAVEKAGIPAVGIAARSFARAWQSCVDGWGQPSTAFVTIPHATTGQQPDFIRNMVDEQIDAIIQGLTVLPASLGTSRNARNGSQATETFIVEMDEKPEGLDAVNRFLAERDWSDGIPVMPPTPAAVEQMLKGTKRQPQDVVMVMEPGFGLATVEKIAINAVMAGCRLEQFPVLLAAIACLAQPQMNHRDMQVSGHTEAPIILVNGPIAKKAGINSGTSAMGPGVVNAANTAIGRALRLCLINIGYCKAGAGDPNYIGLPTKFGMCIAENEESSPWAPYHVEHGYAPEDSTVFAIAAEAPHSVTNHVANDPEGILDSIVSAMSTIAHNNAVSSGSCAVVIGPEHAATIADKGWTRSDVRNYLWMNAGNTFGEISFHGRYGKIYNRNLPRWYRRDPEARIPVVPRAEEIHLFVAGGDAGRFSAFIPGWGHMTAPVLRPLEGIPVKNPALCGDESCAL